MSHRVTNRTKIRDRELCVKALQQAGYSYTDIGNGVLHVTSGPMTGADIDTTSGVVSSDAYSHARRDLDALNQPYAEMLARKEAMVRGIQIESRQVLEDGRIRLLCSGSI